MHCSFLVSSDSCIASDQMGPPYIVTDLLYSFLLSITSAKIYKWHVFVLLQVVPLKQHSGHRKDFVITHFHSCVIVGIRHTELRFTAQPRQECCDGDKKLPQEQHMCSLTLLLKLCQL